MYTRYFKRKVHIFRFGDTFQLNLTTVVVIPQQGIRFNIHHQQKTSIEILIKKKYYTVQLNFSLQLDT